MNYDIGNSYSGKTFCIVLCLICRVPCLTGLLRLTPLNHGSPRGRIKAPNVRFQRHTVRLFEPHKGAGARRNILPAPDGDYWMPRRRLLHLLRLLLLCHLLKC